MKKYILAILVCTILFSCQQKSQHVCVDKNHETCDGKCQCDGMQCPTIYNIGDIVYYQGDTLFVTSTIELPYNMEDEEKELYILLRSVKYTKK